ncbi:MAG: hypothetical protein RDV48_11020 [Candidatus Eremiobacteraeota bacterium]|nr:hypothetical protein [Candidatus Eremiobacteraeota bacterium]
MVRAPSKDLRGRILGSISRRNDALFSLWKPFFTGGAKVTMAPWVHCYRRGREALLLNGRTLVKIRGKEGLEAFFGSLSTEAHDFLGLSTALAPFGDPQELIEILAGASFLVIKEDGSPGGGRPPGEPPSPRALQALYIDAGGPLCCCDLCGISPGRGTAPVSASLFTETLEAAVKIDSLQALIISSAQGPLPVPGTRDRACLAAFREKGLRLIALLSEASLASSLPVMPLYGFHEADVFVEMPGPALRQQNFMGLRKCSITVIPVITIDEKGISPFRGFIAEWARQGGEAVRVRMKGSPGRGRALASLYLQCFEWLRERGIREISLGRRLHALVAGLPIAASCALYGGQLSFAPGGEVSRCPFMSDPPFLPPLPLEHSECRRCPALGICGGLCLAGPGEKAPGKGTFQCDFLEGLVEAVMERILAGDSRGGNADGL